MNYAMINISVNVKKKVVVIITGMNQVIKVATHTKGGGLGKACSRILD